MLPRSGRERAEPAQAPVAADQLEDLDDLPIGEVGPNLGELLLVDLGAIDDQANELDECLVVVGEGWGVSSEVN